MKLEENLELGRLDRRIAELEGENRLLQTELLAARRGIWDGDVFLHLGWCSIYKIELDMTFEDHILVYAHHEQFCGVGKIKLGDYWTPFRDSGGVVGAEQFWAAVCIARVRAINDAQCERLAEKFRRWEWG